MPLQHSISSSKNALVINLDQVQVEEIVEEKLGYFLGKRPLGKNVLKSFYEPAEQALIETSLERLRGNQLKTAKVLGINRNTLKKKIMSYDLNIKELLIRQKALSCPHNRIFLSSISSMDLLFACRAKMALDSFQNKIPAENALRQICSPVEKRVIQRVLEFCKGNQIRASRFLGINRNTLKKKMSLINRVQAS